MRKFICAVVVAAAFCPRAQAASHYWDWLSQYKQPNIHVGQLAVHPYYKLTETYDSNIYLVPRDQPGGVVVGGGVRGSWITKNNLGLEANLPWRKLHNLALGYDFESQLYSTQPDVNDSINQTAHADYSYKGAYGLTYTAGDQYVNTTDQAFSELIQRNRRWLNHVYTGLDYNPENGRLAGGLDADHETDKYLDPTLAAGLNRYEDSAGFNVGYKVQPKTKAYVSYHRGIIHYTVQPGPGGLDKDSKSHSLGFGLIGQLTAKLEGQVEGGFTYRKYDQAARPGGDTVRQSPTVTTNVTYHADPYTTANLRLSRYLQESIDPSNPFYYANEASLDVKHKFPYKLSAGINLAIAIDKYPEAQTFGTTVGNRRDDIYQGGLWVEYDIQKWLSTGLSYLYRERDSTFSSQFNYQDQQTSWNIKAKF